MKLFIVALLAMFFIAGVAPVWSSDQPSKFDLVQIHKKKVAPIIIDEDIIFGTDQGGGA